MKQVQVRIGIVFVFLLLFTTVGSVEGRTLWCAYCHREIVRGSYYTLDGKNFHAHCYRRVPKCRICGKPITGRIVLEGGGTRRYHERCYDHALRCAICGLTIDRGRYVTVGDAVYHQRCYLHTEKCALCGKAVVPGEGAIDTPDGPVHARCDREAVKCQICRRVIHGTYHVDLYGRPYCSRHDGVAVCDVCRYPEVAFELDDGRLLCKRCGISAVFPEEETKRRFARLVRIVEETFGLPIDAEVELHLVGRDMLKRLEGPTDGAQLGKFIRRTATIELPFGFSKTLRDTFDIYVLYGLPEPLFEAVCVHELVHAWQALYAPPDQEPLLTEGTAELISYLFLEREKARVWMSMIENNRSDLYRHGFERARERYRRLGLERFLEFTATRKGFP